jgi:hypothetical protein
MTGLGNALVDTGSQVSLVTERSLNKGSEVKNNVVKIHGIAGNAMETIGRVDLCVGEIAPHEFLVVKSLTMRCDIVIGAGLAREVWVLFSNTIIRYYSSSLFRNSGSCSDYRTRESVS